MTATAALLTDCDRFPFGDEDRASLHGAGLELRELEGHDPGAIAAAGKDASVVFVYHARMSADLLTQLPRLRVVARCGTGYDNIDVAAARARGVEVIHVPGFGTHEVADHTIALLLACSRKLALCDRQVREGTWPTWTELQPMHRLRGRTLGLVGFGRIARAVATRAAALGLEVLACDPHLDHDIVTSHGAQPSALDDLLAASNFVSLHAPLTEATRGLIGEAELARMRPGSILLNTSRGELVDEEALVRALQSGKLVAAGLDVFASEPLAQAHPLAGLDEVVLQPHSAAFSDEALAELRALAIADALRVLRGERPEAPVP